MGIIRFPQGEDDIDIFSVEVATLDEPGLAQLRSRVEAVIAGMDEKEPREGTAAYDSWAERHEFLEDILDDILDRLEDMGE